MDRLCPSCREEITELRCKMLRAENVKIERYCLERNIRPEIIEILPNGRMFFDLNGKKCEIK